MPHRTPLTHQPANPFLTGARSYTITAKLALGGHGKEGGVDPLIFSFLRDGLAFPILLLMALIWEGVLDLGLIVTVAQALLSSTKGLQHPPCDVTACPR